MTEFVHLAGVRLASLSGHVAIMQAGVPRTLPESLELIARQHGCVPADEVNPVVLTAMAEAAQKPVPAGPAEDSAPDEAAVNAAVKDAIELVMARGNESDLTKDQSRPKLAAVRAELPMGVDVTPALLEAVLADIQ